jgi:hypothetical protein
VGGCRDGIGSSSVDPGIVDGTYLVNEGVANIKPLFLGICQSSWYEKDDRVTWRRAVFEVESGSMFFSALSRAVLQHEA